MLIIDKNIYKYILTIFQKSGTVFIKEGIEMELDSKSSYIYTILTKIFVIIYLIFSIPINYLYVLFNYSKYDYPFLNQLYEISINPLIAPTLECSWLNGINVSKNDTDLFIKMQNKLYWDKIFKKNKTRTPAIVGFINNGITTKNLLFNHKSQYIVKPIVGGLGKNISIYDENKIPSGNYIIQEKIIQDKNRGHFRIITTYDKQSNNYIISNIYLCMNKGDQIASNNHKGGKCHDVNITNNSLRFVKDNVKISRLDEIVSSDLLKLSIEEAIKLHETFPKFVINIAWDVMIANNTYYFLEGNVPGGTVFPNDALYFQKALPINKTIYNSIFS